MIVINYKFWQAHIWETYMKNHLESRPLIIFAARLAGLQLCGRLQSSAVIQEIQAARKGLLAQCRNLMLTC